MQFIYLKKKNFMSFFTLIDCFLICFVLFCFSRNGGAPQHQADFDPGQRSGAQGADADREQVISLFTI